MGAVRELQPISDRLIGRIPILNRCQIVSKYCGVCIRWGIETNRFVFKKMGEINIDLSSGFDWKGDTLDDFKKDGIGYLASQVEIKQANNQELNPFHGAMAVFTLIATANRFSFGINRNFIHLARTNTHSMPIFEKLRQSGLYYYSNLKGNKTIDPVETKSGTLFACEFPSDQIRNMFSRFPILPAVEILEQKYKELSNGR